MKMLLKALCLTVGLALSSNAIAHNSYDYRCCGNNDCAPVADENVKEVGDVILFVVPPGTHPMYGPENTKPLVVEVDRFRVEQRRIDGSWHLCLNAAHFPLCVYPPERGM